MSALTVVIAMAALVALLVSVHAVQRYGLAARYRPARVAAAHAPEQPRSAAPPRP